MDAYEILKEDDHSKHEGCDDRVISSSPEYEKGESTNNQNDLCPLVVVQSNGEYSSKALHNDEELVKKDNTAKAVEGSFSPKIHFVGNDNNLEINKDQLKSVNQGLEMNLSHDSDDHSFVFVSDKATDFGLGSSDADQLIDSPKGNENLLRPEDGNNQAFTTENESPGPTVIESEKSPLFSDHSLVKDLLKKSQQGAKRNDKVPLLPSPAKTEMSSEDDSTLMSASLDMELDSLRSPAQPSSDADEEDLGVCSKYSQLSEDGSSPLFDKMQTSEIGNDGKPSIFENSLELGVAFSEFVDLESFSSSLGHQNPQTEDRFGGKFEDHLLILLKSASHKNLKSFLRRAGWPAESDARRHLWENLCVHLLKAGGNLYEEMASDLYRKQSSEENISLPHFVDSKLISTYHLNTYGIHMVKMVINVIGHLNPDILYCPILYPLTAAFLHYMGPNTCFNCMQALLRSSSPSYLTATKTSTKAVTLVLRDLAKKYAKSAYTYVTRGIDESVFDQWIQWLFHDLPFHTVVSVIDCFLLEGYKVLYRVVLAILSHFTKHMKKTRSGSAAPEDMKAAISTFCSSVPIEPKKLLKSGFSIRGLTRKEIYKLESRHQTHIKNLPPDDSLPKVASSHSFMSETNPELVVENGQKPLLTREMLNTIWSWIPKRLTLRNPSLLYTSDEHGITLRTLFGMTQYAEQTLLVIKSDQDEIFGAFCSASWHERIEKNKPHTSFFGTGETFVFTLKPKMKKFPWVGEDGSKTDGSSDLFMAGDDTILVIGSGHGEAIQLDAMMNCCRSTRCDTFINDPLSCKEDFSCSVVQVYGFVD